MGLAWQHGPLATTSICHFLTAQPLPERLMFVEPLRRRMRVRFGDEWIVDTDDVILLHEPARYPVAYFRVGDIRDGVLTREDRITQHGELGDMRWFTVAVGEHAASHAAWQHAVLPTYAADPYHRIDIRSTSRHLVVRDGEQVIADTRRPVVLYESGFAPRWYVPRADIDEGALNPVEGQTFCPYKGLADYYTIGENKRAAWSYVNAWQEVARVNDLVSFEPDKVEVWLDDERLHLEPGQTVVAQGVDRGLDPGEVLTGAARNAR